MLPGLAIALTWPESKPAKYVPCDGSFGSPHSMKISQVNVAAAWSSPASASYRLERLAASRLPVRVTRCRHESLLARAGMSTGGTVSPSSRAGMTVA
jgi:hypothetical protein